VTPDETPLRVTDAADGAWRRFTIRHPSGNIITLEMVRALREAIDRVGHATGVKLVTLEASGSDFSFGASVQEHLPESIGTVLPEMHRLVQELLALPVPTGAVVRGRCLGGGFELALACDFIFAAEDAFFGLPEIALGVFPPAGTAILPQRIGHARAARYILTGQTRPAAEWAQAGLIELMAPPAGLPRKVEQWFETHLAPRSAAALSQAVLAVRSSLRAHVADALPRLERQYLDRVMATEEAVEGISAFLEKRRAEWKDR
jgi:cyclohexa-1,5-dienecarbonyl-CoA hydratase